MVSNELKPAYDAAFARLTERLRSQMEAEGYDSFTRASTVLAATKVFKTQAESGALPDACAEAALYSVGFW